jgi:anti-sigma regulatory factor (Ser/Thr protein kinase)
MTVPGTDALRKPSAAHSRQAARPLRPVPPSGLQSGDELARMQEWPLRSYLELPAVPTSARSARQHATSVLREWRVTALADTVELLVSEIITNAVRASADIARQRDEAHVVWLRCWLISDGRNVLIQVWDDDHRHPVCQRAGLDAETGRGLLLIESLSLRWGCYPLDAQGGKVVWAVCAG